MYDRILIAIQAQQFTEAAKLLKQWQHKQPDDPWFKLATGKYWEAKGELEKAQMAYTRLLQDAANTKVLGQAREGMQRVRDQLARRREHDLNAAKARPGSEAASVLILQPVVGAQREQAMQSFSKIMQIDAYTARMKIPSQHWRLYRVGAAGELQYFCEQLQAANIPAFCTAVADVKAIPVFRVQAIQSFEPEITLLCHNSSGQRGTLQLRWDEISQWLVGVLPVYESVVDLGPWGKLQRKETTQDYSEVMDWHLHGRGCILRFCDRTYRHRESAPLLTSRLTHDAPLMAAAAWKDLKSFCQQAIVPSPHTDFTGFGEGAIDFIDLMPDLPPQIDLARQAPSHWDTAFHLYSGLRFLQGATVKV